MPGTGEWLNRDFEGSFPMVECILGNICCLFMLSSTLDAAARDARIERHDLVVASLGAMIVRPPWWSRAGLRVLRGNLAPDGAIIKPSAATDALLEHEGEAYVFESIEDFKANVDRDDLPVTPDTILVLKGCGPKGYPGMPEVGNMPIPKKLVQQGVRDMVRISDARMSGTAYGTAVLHVAPEAAAGGPIGLVRNGDRIRLAGEGEAGATGAPPGDLYVEVRVRPHRIFERDGDDLEEYSAHDRVVPRRRLARQIAGWLFVLRRICHRTTLSRGIEAGKPSGRPCGAAGRRFGPSGPAVRTAGRLGSTVRSGRGRS